MQAYKVCSRYGEGLLIGCLSCAYTQWDKASLRKNCFLRVATESGGKKRGLGQGASREGTRNDPATWVQTAAKKGFLVVY